MKYTHNIEQESTVAVDYVDTIVQERYCDPYNSILKELEISQKKKKTYIFFGAIVFVWLIFYINI